MTFHNLRGRLFESVDGASLAIFRIAFGLIMFWEVTRYFSKGWIPRYYINPDFHFTYYGFEWVTPWPGDGMYWHFVALGVLSLLIALGAFYRLAIILFFVAFSYVFLLDQTQYLNHFYLVMLVGFLMCFLPANRLWSIDAWVRPRLRSNTIPQWAIWALVIQFEMILLYAGIVKITPDWLHLQPLTLWMAEESDMPLIGSYLTQTWAVALASYGSIILHLIGAPLLLWKRTRFWVFMAYSLFHMTNAFAFQIGIFPWITIAGTLMFFDPEWPRMLWRRIKSHWYARPIPAPTTHTPDKISFAAALSVQRWIVGFLAVFFIFQLLFPQRHLLYPGDVEWTEEGHRFSWRMKLRDKNSHALFTLTDPATGRSWEVRDDYLTKRQYGKMAARPDMVLQYAHHLATVWRDEKNVPQVEVRATVWCALNGRRPALLIDPERNLAEVERDLWPADWILPLHEPLSPQRVASQ